AEQWIELHNRSAAPVLIEGWKLSDAVSFIFPAGTTIAAGGFVVVAWDPSAFTALHPGIPALGPWSSSLSGSGETITLRDINDNVADQVTYADGGLWSKWADGGGSSLELRDPDADNSRGEAWDASDESATSEWLPVTYTGTAANGNPGDPTNYNEFVFGLLGEGEFLIDDISVKNVTKNIPELIQNGGFSGGTAASWRIIGTHAGTVVDDPAAAGNKVLKVASSGSTEHMHNHAETTLKNGAAYHAIVTSDTYTISFRAKWLRGSNRFHARLWHNRLARQTLLPVPVTGGTPGAANGKRVENIGPTFNALAHTPVVPPATQPATVTIRVADPDGIATVELFTSVNGAAFTSVAMSTVGDGLYSAVIAGKSASTLVRFYVQATDSLGAVSLFPSASARAMIPWADGRAQLTLASGAKPHNIRVVLPTAEATELYKAENLMSDAPVPCTVILNESIAFYRAGVRLKSSEHGRISDGRCGYTLEFPRDDLFLGIHDTIALDRSGGISTGQKEILLKRLTNSAGGIYAPEDDICRVISAVGSSVGRFTGSNITGAAILSKTRLDKEFLDAQWENGGDGSQHKYERVYVLTETINPGTRVVTEINASTVLTAIAEQPKVPQDNTGPPGVGVNSLGANKENYRWYWLLQNNRDADDFTGIINVVNALGQPGGSTAFRTLVNQHIDVTAWLRATIPSALYGVVDNYLGSGGGQHNALVFFPPGQKAVLMPWDLDYLDQSNPSTSLINGGDVSKFIANPVWKRLYYGQLLDVLNRSFNTTFMTKWATHYSRFGTDNLTAQVSSYLTPRANYALNVINGTGGQIAAIAKVPFRITTVSPVTVSTPFATIIGDGWINVAEIRLQGSNEPLAATWTDDNSWTLQLPIMAGTNLYTLVAYDNTGLSLGTATVTVTGNGSVFPAGPGNLIVSELNYNPAGSSDSTEFLELLNTTGAALDLSGCHFDEENGEGIAYTFANGVQIASGARLIIARNRTDFLAQYPDAATQLAAGQYDPTALDNNGEELVLYAASGLEIFRFSYSDNLASTDGNGRSLVRTSTSGAPVWRESLSNGGN
ncbi:MAG: lamin tail domain-containing protein, partial [Verrucomicrobiota bacterium]